MTTPELQGTQVGRSLPTSSRLFPVLHLAIFPLFVAWMDRFHVYPKQGLTVHWATLRRSALLSLFLV